MAGREARSLSCAQIPSAPDQRTFSWFGKGCQCHTEILKLRGRSTVFNKNFQNRGRCGSHVPESMRRTFFHEERLAGNCWHRLRGADSDFQFSRHGNPQVVPDIVVGV